MVVYYCEVCDKKSEQKGHHVSHLKQMCHLKNCQIVRLKLQQRPMDHLKSEHPLIPCEDIDDKDAQKFDFIEAIIQSKINGAMSNPSYKKHVNNTTVWEHGGSVDRTPSDIKTTVMGIIKRTHQIFYNHGVNQSQVLPDISKILGLILLQPLFLDMKSHIWEAINKLDITEHQRSTYVKYCTNIEDLLKEEDPKYEWKEMVSDMLIHIFPYYFIEKDSKLDCDNVCFVDAAKALNDIPGIFNWSSDKDYKTNYTTLKDRYDGDLTGDINEYFKNKYGGTGKELGQFFTPPKLIHAILKGLNIVEHIDRIAADSASQQTIYDPCLGSAGFLVSANQMSEKTLKLMGGEKDSYTIKWAFQSLLIETGDIQKAIQCTDSIATLVERGCHILTNPPFAISMNYDNEEKEYKRLHPDTSVKFKDIYPLMMNEPEAMFLQHCVYHLGENCICCIIVPYGKLFEGTQKRIVALRKWLMEQVDITDIMLMPRGVFDYANPLTCTIVFVKRKSRGKISFKEMSQDCKTIKHLFDISGDDVLSSGHYSLSHSDYVHHELRSAVQGVKLRFRDIFEMKTSDIKSGDEPDTNGGPYKLVTGAKYENWKNIDSYDHEGEYVFMCTGGNGDAVPIKYHSGKFKYSNLMCMLVVKPEYKEAINVKYIYYMLLNNQTYIEQNMQKGSSNRTLHPRVNDMVVTLPTIGEQNDYIDILNKRDIEYLEKQKEVRDYKCATEDLISHMFPTTEA
jgi:hypothetical protein